ncbi:hypothetical protein CPB86DRAFT_54107 [Serendipita vermifera]|nr:hypothetical protein CPB86DRAFT_54107 [Serendipita vermifera]
MSDTTQCSYYDYSISDEHQQKRTNGSYSYQMTTKINLMYGTVSGNGFTIDYIWIPLFHRLRLQGTLQTPRHICHPSSDR